MNNTWDYIWQEFSNNLLDHDNFFLDYKDESIKIYPELVEVAEHVILWLEKNPKFKHKIMNAEYEMLIWDDWSWRAITLLIRLIINHFNEKKWISQISNLFIDNIDNIPKKRMKDINTNRENIRIPKISLQEIQEICKDKRILICTEYIETWFTISNIIKKIKLENKNYDIFTQAYHSLYYSWIEEIKNKIIFVLKDNTPKIYDSDYETSKFSFYEVEESWFLHYARNEENIKAIKENHFQIKLLAEYIIKKHLS